MVENKELAIYNLYQQQREKYVYYLLAACVASAAFAIDRTNGKALSYVFIPHGISVVCWGISIWSGLTLLQNVQGALVADFEHAQEQKKSNLDPEQLNKKILVQRATIEKNSRRKSKLLYYFFILGFLVYIVGHIMEMSMIKH